VPCKDDDEYEDFKKDKDKDEDKEEPKKEIRPRRGSNIGKHMFVGSGNESNEQSIDGYDIDLDDE
jgi:hypothetical protein